EEVVGTVLDVDATRVLFVDDTGVRIKDRATNVVTTIGSGTPATETFGHLVSAGAAWTNGDWIGGVTTARGTPLVRARGDWGVRHKLGAVSVDRENLATGAIETFSGSAPTYGYGDIDPAGTIVWSTYQSGTYPL